MRGTKRGTTYSDNPAMGLPGYAAGGKVTPSGRLPPQDVASVIKANGLRNTSATREQVLAYVDQGYPLPRAASLVKANQAGQIPGFAFGGLVPRRKKADPIEFSGTGTRRGIFPDKGLKR